MLRHSRYFDASGHDEKEPGDTAYEQWQCEKCLAEWIKFYPSGKIVR